jgi:hypothetical protein
VYARTVGDQELTFVVSGMLWQRSLVMMDSETESLWSHLLGRSMRGELVDTQLETLPALLTDWETWKRTHPETTVMLMRRTADGFTRDMYRDLRGFVAGMSDGENCKAWSFKDLESNPLINDTFGEQPIVVAFQKESATPFVFIRKLDGRSLSFAVKDAMIVDQQTESTWDMEFGVATGGELKGKKLQPVVAISSFSEAWKKFHPESEYWEPERK